MKRCVHCECRKPADAFPPNAKCRDGLSSWCRECHRAAAREHSARTYVKRERQPRPVGAKPLPLATCRGCSIQFVRPANRQGASQRYCNRDCAARSRRAYKRSAPRPSQAAPRVAKECPHCGAAFVGTLLRNPTMREFCSPDCGRRWHRNWNTYRRRVMGSTFRVDRVTRRELAAITGWVCGICDATIDPGLAWPDPWSQSLDHIIPVARGGGHIIENLQLAHLRCNIRKSSRLVA